MEADKEERRLYFTSDTHHELLSNKQSERIDIFPVEMSKEKEEKGGRNFLALCGDIGNPFDSKYEAFLARHSSRFEKIFVVAGNHEYYSNKKQRTVENTDEKIQEICSKFSNVIPLQKQTFEIEGTVFAGCTLWTPVDQYSDTLMNDYKNIFVNGTGSYKIILQSGLTYKNTYIKPGRRPIQPDDVFNLHQEMKGWLNETISHPSNQNKNLIVLTHHAPVKEMIGEPKGHREIKTDGTDPRKNPHLLKCYAGECESLFRSPVTLWVSGHTHSCISTEVNGIKSLSNCWGYPGQKTGIDKTTYVTF